MGFTEKHIVACIVLRFPLKLIFACILLCFALKRHIFACFLVRFLLKAYFCLYFAMLFSKNLFLLVFCYVLMTTSVPSPVLQCDRVGRPMTHLPGKVAAMDSEGRVG